MCSFRHRLWHSGLVFFVLTLLLAVGFIVEIVKLYNDHLKHLRLQEYKAAVSKAVWVFYGNFSRFRAF